MRGIVSGSSLSWWEYVVVAPCGESMSWWVVTVERRSVKSVSRVDGLMSRSVPPVGRV